MDLPLTYKWQQIDGMAEGSGATADTPAGRMKVARRRPGLNKFVAWVRGEVLGREYVSLETAQRVAETKVKKMLERRDSGA